MNDVIRFKYTLFDENINALPKQSIIQIPVTYFEEALVSNSAPGCEIPINFLKISG